MDIIAAMMHGCRVSEVVDILRTHRSAASVCRALAEERDAVAAELTAYLATRGQPEQPPEPPGPPPGRASSKPRLSPGPGAGRAPPATAASQGSAAASGNPPPIPPRWEAGGPVDHLWESSLRQPWTGHQPRPSSAQEPRARGSVAREVAAGGGKGSGYTDWRLHGSA